MNLIVSAIGGSVMGTAGVGPLPNLPHLESRRYDG